MLLLPLLFAAAGDAYAQVWHQERDNAVYNVQSVSVSPVSLSHNPTASWNAASASWNYENGEFHRPDAPAGKSELDLSVAETGTLGKFRTAGGIQYRNTREFSRNWNSLIGNDPDNPYIICDTLADDSTTERFDIEGLLSWDFAPNWTLAGKVGLTTATLSDNKDPRPKNDISRAPLSMGLEYIMPGGWSAGVFGGAELFFSKFTNYLEYGQKAYRYYKMMGMGEFFAYSSSESASAPREYEGKTYYAGINACLRRESIENFTELACYSGYENARDGGSAYEWKAGDYSFTRFSFRERLDIKGYLRQSINVSAEMKLTNGFWYDQKQRVDTDHGNLTYYEVMSRYKNNSASRIVAGAGYSVGAYKSWNASVGASFRMENFTHYTDGDSHKQSWNRIETNAAFWKTLRFGKHVLDISASAAYIMPVGEPAYDTGNSAKPKDDISKRYVEPAFAYETATKIKASLRADWVLPQTRKAGLCPGLFAQGSALASVEGKAFYGCSLGAFLKF